MKKGKDDSLPPAELRRLAERRLRERKTETVQAGPDQDALRLLHELQVHQVELEMQNEELGAARMSAEAELERYTDLYDFAPVGYFTLTRDGQIVEVNLTGAALLGAMRPGLVRRRLGRFVAPDEAGRWSQHLASVLRSPERQACELPFRRQDGSPFYARLDSIRLDRPSPDDRAGGQLPAMRVAMSDVTDRKRAEDALRSSEARYRSYIEVAGQLGWTTNADGEVTEDLPSWRKFTGQTVQGIRGWGWAQALHPDDVARTSEVWRKALDDKKRYEIEYRIRRHDGLYRHFLARGVPVLRDDGTVLEWVGTCIDITDHKQSEEALQQAAEELERSNKDLEQFASVASHDLQEPLRAVAGYAGLLQARYRGVLDERGDTFLQGAADGAARMQRLIDDLLAYSRVGTRGGALQVVDAGAALDVALANLEAAIREAGAIVLRDPLPAVHADAGQLAQLFQNLVGNAIKFRGDRNPQIRVGAARQSGAWVFTVQDNGIGIDPLQRERVFAIFRRLHPRSRYPGTGIGLAICKRIVERHGGRIWVESAPGRGSTFSFTLSEGAEG